MQRPFFCIYDPLWTVRIILPSNTFVESIILLLYFFERSIILSQFSGRCYPASQVAVVSHYSILETCEHIWEAQYKEKGMKENSR